MQTPQPCPTQSGPAYQPEPTNDVDEKGSVVLSPPAPSVHFTPPNIPHQQSNVGVCEFYAHARARRMGCSHIAFGVLALMFQTIAIFTSAGSAFVGAGIWNGILFMLCGTLAIWSAHSKTSCSIVGLMVMSIMCSIMCVSLLIISAVGLGWDNACQYEVFNDRSYGYGSVYKEKSCKSALLLSTNGSLMVLSVAEFVLCLVTSATCCGAVCCGSRTPRTGTWVSQPTITTITTTQPAQPAAQPAQPAAQSAAQQAAQQLAQPAQLAAQSAQPAAQPAAQPSQPAAQPAQPAAQPAQTTVLSVSQQPYLHSPITYGQLQLPYPQASQLAYPYPQPEQSSAQLSAQPSAYSPTQPSAQPSAYPPEQPLAQLLAQPSAYPPAQPSAQPSAQPPAGGSAYYQPAQPANIIAPPPYNEIPIFPESSISPTALQAPQDVPLNPTALSALPDGLPGKQ